MKKSALCVGLVLALSTTGCTMTTPSQLTVDRIQVEQGHHAEILRRDEITPDVWGGIVDAYNRNAEGTMKVYVSYPDGVKGAAEEANRLARQYGAVLSKKGIDDLVVTVVPSPKPELQDRVVVSYNRFEAVPPEDCGRITGAFGGESVYDIPDYKIGCEHMRYMSRMVSDPTDLLGKGPAHDGDARRAGNIVERYRTGEEFEPLDSSSASGLGE